MLFAQIPKYHDFFWNGFRKCRDFFGIGVQWRLYK